jgi:hypothetical protein
VKSRQSACDNEREHRAGHSQAANIQINSQQSWEHRQSRALLGSH